MCISISLMDQNRYQSSYNIYQSFHIVFTSEVAEILRMRKKLGHCLPRLILFLNVITMEALLIFLQFGTPGTEALYFYPLS